jgi:hypothetical protein
VSGPTSVWSAPWVVDHAVAGAGHVLAEFNLREPSEGGLDGLVATACRRARCTTAAVDPRAITVRRTTLSWARATPWAT